MPYAIIICYVMLLPQQKGAYMPAKRKDNKGRTLRNGETQQPDGRYKFRYTDENGERRTVYSWKLVETDKLKEGQRGQESLREKEKRILKDLDDHIKTKNAEKTTVNDMFEKFMEIRVDLRGMTRKCYRDLFTVHVYPSIGNRPVGKVKPSDIQKLYQSAVAERGVTPSTVQKVHSVVYQVFEIAVVDNLIRTNPSSNAFKYFAKTNDVVSKPREALTVEQQENFIDFVYSSHIYSRLGNLFTVLLGTGLRIGEALALTWDDINFDTGIISVYKTMAYKPGEDGRYDYRISPPKTASGTREVPMLDEVEAALLREKSSKKPKKKFVVEGYSGFVFLNSAGQVYTNSFLYDSIQGIVETYNREELMKANLEKRQPVYLPKMSAHIFRHTFCTRMCEQDVNLKVLQDIMGHRNIRTTMEVYAKATREKKQDAIKELNGKFKIS